MGRHAEGDLGLTLQTIGMHEPGSGDLIEAVTAFREARRVFTRERDPRTWGMRTQQNLGSTLTELANRQSGVDYLKQAILANREALKEITHQNDPLILD